MNSNKENPFKYLVNLFYTFTVVLFYIFIIFIGVISFIMLLSIFIKLYGNDGIEFISMFRLPSRIIFYSMLIFAYAFLVSYIIYNLDRKFEDKRMKRKAEVDQMITKTIVDTITKQYGRRKTDNRR